jgi:hypothetical protein
MSEEKSQALGDPPDDWVKIWYQTAHSDIRWAKEQGWRALQWTVVLLAGLVAAARQIGSIPQQVFLILIFTVAAFAIFYQADLHKFAKHSRSITEGVLKKVPGRKENLPKRKFDPDHRLYLIVRIAVILGAAVFAVAVMDP